MSKSKVRKDAKIKNRVHKTYKIKWARGVITIRAMVDLYPEGNFVTYFMSVSKHGEVIERNSFAMNNSSHMMGRVEYFQSIVEEVV